MNQQNQSEHLLKEIRNMLLSESRNSQPSSQPNQTLSQQVADKMIEESFRLLKPTQLKNDPNLTHSKIKEASQLLSTQNPMIQSYIKDKINSSFFSHKHHSDKEQEQLLKMKEKLQKKRLQQRIEEQKKLEGMIESTRKYVKNQKVKSVPIPQIESIIRKQPYYNFQREDYNKRSQNNSIQFSKNRKSLLDDEDDDVPQQKAKRIKDKSPTKLNTSRMQDIYEIDEGQEDQTKFMNKAKTNKIKNIKTVLINNPKFLMCFKAFLEKQMRIVKINTGSSIYNDLQLHRNSISSKNSKVQKNKYQYKVRARNFEEGKIMKKERSLSSITKKFKTKGLLIQPENIDQNAQKCKKTINKKIGDSNKFHLKQCILTSNFLYYADEQNQEEDVNINKMKKLEVQFLNPEITKIKKEQGNVFQKKEAEVEVVTLKGKKRNVHFEKDYAEGAELYLQIKNLLCMKFHNMNCLLSMRIHSNMEQFIRGKHKILDFSQQYIRNFEEYPDKGYRNIGLSLILGLFPQRQTTNQILLENSKLNPSELNTILNSAQTYFESIKNIEAAKNKLNKQNLGNIFKLIKKCPAKHLMTLDLSNCSIDHQCFVSNILNFNKVFSKIQTLILKGNQINAQTLQSLTSCLASKVCEIKQIDISGCPIYDIIGLANVIKASHKLTVLKADNCGFDLNDGAKVKYLLQCCNSSSLKSLSLKKNQPLKNLQILEANWKSKKPIEIELDINSQLKNTLHSEYIGGQLLV